MRHSNNDEPSARAARATVCGILFLSLLALGCGRAEPTSNSSTPRLAVVEPVAVTAPRDEKKTEGKNMDEPKGEPKKGAPKELTEGTFTYTERVTIKVWIAAQKGFLNPIPNQWAFRREIKGELVFGLRGGTINTTPTTGSVITDADGNEYLITHAHTRYDCYARPLKKP